MFTAKSLSVAKTLLIAVMYAACGSICMQAAVAQPENQTESPKKTGALLELADTIKLPELKGPLGHMGVDLIRNRLFVAAEEDDAVAVIDMGEKKLFKKLAGIPKPRAVVHMQGIDLIAVSCAGDGSVRVLNGSSLAEERSVAVGKEPGAMLFDPMAGTLYVAYGRPGIAPVGPVDGKREKDIDVVSVPSALRLMPSIDRILANVPRGVHVAVIDRTKRLPLTNWFLREARDNFAFALDDETKRVFVACRTPPVMLALDAETGKSIAKVPIAKECDDVHFDALAKRIYVSGGEGVVSLIHARTADRYDELGTVTTAPGAKTSLWIKETRTLYVAVPPRGSEPPEVRAYKAPL